MPRGGGKKGNPFENYIAKELSYWWSNGERDDLVRRTQASGGIATVRSKTGTKTKYQHGDLCPSDPEIAPFFDYFLVETKRGYNEKIDLLDYLDLPLKRIGIPHLKMWKDKALIDMKEGERKHFLILLKRDNRDPVVAMEYSFFQKLFTDFIYSSYLGKCILMDGMVLTKFCDFFSFFEPSHFKKLFESDQ